MTEQIMDFIDSIPDYVLWTIFVIICIDVIRRYIKTRKFKRRTYKIFPEIQSLHLIMNHRPLSEPKLSIFGFEPSNCEKTFLLSKFSPTLFDRITTQYPFINDLNLTISLQSFMDKSELINQFFRFYHDLITSLYIHVYVTNETNVDIRQYLNKTLDMLSEINFLGNLVKLVVDIEPLPETYTIEFITPIHDFQVLPQLKKLYFATPLNSFNLLNESFRTYPPTRLNNMAFGYEQSRGFVNSYPLSDNFCLMIDQLHYHTLSFQPLPMYQTISELSTRYHFLSRLTIQLDQLYPLRLINSLSRLRKLEYLSIFLSHQSGEKINFDLSSIDQAKPQMISKLVPLNHLIVRCTVSSHKSFQSVHLGWIFPNLISLEFSYDAFVCEEPSCGAKHVCGGRWNWRAWKCRRSVLSQWKKQCPNLKYTYMNCE